VLHIHEHDNGMLWLGTLRNGLLLFDPDTEIFKADFTVNDGMIDNSVNVTFGDNSGNLWMSTWHGIVRLSLRDTIITNYSLVNGLPFHEFNSNAFFIDKNGKFWLGGQGGVVGFHPDTFVNFDACFPLGITSAHNQDGLIALKYPLREGSSFRLPYNLNDFIFTFSAFDFRNAGQRSYRYRLKGWRNEWRVCRDNNLTAEFGGLKPGSYIFQLQSTYKGWPWVKEEINVEVIVLKPPFYLRSAFWLGMSISGFISLVAAVILMIRNIKARKEIQISHLEKEANQSTLNFLKSQMNPHFYFNTLNAINCFVLRNETRTANKFLTTFASLMREILENSQKDFITITEESAVLEKYLRLQQLRFPGLFEFKIEVHSSVANDRIPPMLLQPFIENSVEYAFIAGNDSGLITLRFIKTDGHISCEVIDNGIGIVKSQYRKIHSSRKSTALINIAKRIEILQKIYNVKIEFTITEAFPDSNDMPGTHVVIKFPVIIQKSLT
jgi:hypothetical protein